MYHLTITTTGVPRTTHRRYSTFGRAVCAYISRVVEMDLLGEAPRYVNRYYKPVEINLTKEL